MSLRPGVGLGPYEILSPLGAGGMGEVYKARDTRLGREVAVKVLPAEFAADPERLRRFEQEARATAALDHPSILAIHDIGTHDGTPYIVEQLLEGESLRQRLRGGPLTPAKAVEFGIQIANGLAAAHEKGIIHRDLKPENLWVTKDGRIKILDFGLARLRSQSPLPGDGRTEAPTADAPTREGRVLGTPGYMSPEQVRGQAADARADLFSFGVVLYEMVSGQKAFAGTTATDVAAAILKEDPPDLVALAPKTPPVLAQLVRRCLEKRPEDRFSSARDLAFALGAISGSEAHGAEHQPLAPHSPVLRRYGKVLVGLAAVVLLVGTALVTDLGGSRSKLFAPNHAVLSPRSIAVLPLANLSGDPNQDYFSDGLSEDLMGLLGKVKELRVAGRTSSFAFKGKNVEVAELGRQLHVAAVLEGSVRRSGDRLRVSVQLVNVSDGYQIWAETYDRTMTEVFAMQDEIAGAVVAALKITLLPQERAATSQNRTANPEAYTQYLLGRHFDNLYTPEGWRQAVQAHESAIQLDPGYAAAYAGLSVAQFNLASFTSATSGELEEGLRKARASAEKALALDPNLAEGYAARGYVRNFDFPPDWAGAQADFNQALALDPGNADARLHYCEFLSRVGRLREAIAGAKKEVDLDPISGLGWQFLGYYLLSSGDLSGARKALTRSLEISPDNIWGHYQMGVCSLLQGDPIAALPEFARAPELFSLTGTAMAEFALGHDGASQQMLDELIAKYSETGAYQIAVVYAWRREKDKAFAWLNRACAQRDRGLAELRIDPTLGALRPDPQFQTLLCKMEFPGSCEGKP